MSEYPDRHLPRQRPDPDPPPWSDSVRRYSRSLVIGGDLFALAGPFGLLVASISAAVALAHATASDNGARDRLIATLFYGGLFGVLIYPLFLCGYIAGRILAVLLGGKRAATIGYAGLVASLLLAIFVNKWAAIILGATPSVGALTSAALMAFGERRAAKPERTMAID